MNNQIEGAPSNERAPWLETPVMRASRQARLYVDNGQNVPNYTASGEDVGVASLKVHLTFFDDAQGCGVPESSEVHLYVSTTDADRFAALRSLAEQHISSYTGHWPEIRTVAEIVGEAVAAALGAADDDGVQMMHAQAIAAAVKHHTQFWIAAAPRPGNEGNCIYGSVSEDDYHKLRSELERSQRRPTNYSQMVRDIVLTAAPVGSNVDRLLMLNGTMHPLDPRAIGR